MCVTMEWFILGLCSECSVRSAAYQKSETMCPFGDRYMFTPDCRNGYGHYEISYTLAPPSLEGGCILRSHCIRCYKEARWHLFRSRFVEKTAPDCWQPNQLEYALIDYFAEVPDILEATRWWRRTLQWYPFMVGWSDPVSDEDPDLRSIRMLPHRAKRILLYMERRRLDREEDDFEFFMWHHLFPLWWDEGVVNCPVEWEGQVRFVRMSEAEHWDNVPHPYFDSVSWLPEEYRWTDWDGNKDPLVGH